MKTDVPECAVGYCRVVGNKVVDVFRTADYHRHCCNYQCAQYQDHCNGNQAFADKVASIDVMERCIERLDDCKDAVGCKEQRGNDTERQQCSARVEYCVGYGIKENFVDCWWHHLGYYFH